MPFPTPPAVAASDIPLSGLTPTARDEAAIARGNSFSPVCPDIGLDVRLCPCDFCSKLRRLA